MSICHSIWRVGGKSEALKEGIFGVTVITLGGATPNCDFDPEYHIAWTLLHRYGVVFRKILDREPALPPWRELLYAYRRPEARGDINGGRFVQQFLGERFTHPKAIGELAKMRREEKMGELAAVSAADPLNLVGIVTPGSRLAGTGTNRVLYRDGVPVAFHQGGEVRLVEKATPQKHWDARERLSRCAGARLRNTSAL